MLARPEERGRVALFPQSALISQLCPQYLKNWNTILLEKEITFGNAFLLCLHVKNCYPVLFSAICGFATKCSFTGFGETYNRTCTPLRTPKTIETCKKSTPCLIKKASRCAADRTSKTTTFFISQFLWNTKILQKNHVYLLFHWFSGENCIYIFFTQRTTDFDKSKRNMNDGTIFFLTSLFSVLTWKILLLFSFPYKIISCFDHNIWNNEKENNKNTSSFSTLNRC